MKNRLILFVLFILIVSLIACTVIEETNMRWITDGGRKENYIVHYRPADNNRQNIYMLGTVHGLHFDEQYNYSLADIQSVIDVIRPDLLLVEVRQDTFEKYGALDGPTEMIFGWCYAKEKGIDVMGIDWWHPSIGLPNTTSYLRDNNINDNIISAINNKKNILVLIGAGHLDPQDSFFIRQGYRRIKITNKEKYFQKNKKFVYPKDFELEQEKQIEYYVNTFINDIYAIPEDNPSRDIWLNHLLPNKKNVYTLTMHNEAVEKIKLHKKRGK